MTNRALLLGLLPFAAFFVGAAAVEPLPSLSTIAVPLVIVVILVVVNGFFVAAEFAIISVRSSRMNELAEAGNTRASAIGKVLDVPSRQDTWIATAQLGITIASLGLGMYGEPKVAEFLEPYLNRLTGLEGDILHTGGFILALSLLTYLHVVIGEMIPKSLALSSSDETVLAVLRPMQLIQTLFSVPVRFLNAIGNSMLRLLRIPPAAGHARLHSAEELELLVNESAEDGLLNLEEQEIILNIFDFSDRTVEQVMTPRRKVQALRHSLPLDQVRRRVSESRHSRFPVYDDDLDHIVGVLHVKDLVQAELSGDDFAWTSLLRPLPAVPESLPVATLLSVFKRQRLHMARVLDEFGGVAGIVTLEDLVEEIVGEVRDEFDVEKEPFVQIGPGLIEVAGSYLVDDLVDYVYLGEESTLPDVETVGGLIVTWLGRPPQVGDTYRYNEEVQFTVLEVDGLAVGRASVQFPQLANEDEENPKDSEE